MNYEVLKRSLSETQYTCAGLPPCPNCDGEWLMVTGSGSSWGRGYTCSCRSCGQMVRYSRGLALGQPITDMDAGSVVDAVCAEYSKRKLRDL